MRVHADRDVEAFSQRPYALAEAVRRQRAGRVGDVNAVGAVALHEARLEQQLLGRNHVRHHQEADRLHAATLVPRLVVLLIERIVLDIERLRQLLGFEPISLQEGIARTHGWLASKTGQAA